MNYKALLRHRQAWMGIAMVLIVLFHIPTAIPVPILRQLQTLGYCGVDICFFASGIGCYFSLSKDGDAGRFMQRRLRKLAPTYLVFMFFWLIYQAVCGNWNLQMAVGNILAVQSFTGFGQDLNWYVCAIFLFYLLTPYFKQIVDRGSARVKVLFLLILVAVSVPFWNAGNILLTVTRLPIYYLGLLCAPMFREETPIPKRHFVYGAVSLAVGTGVLLAAFVFFRAQLWTKGLYWYPFILITPPMCLALSWLMDLLDKTKLTRLVADGFRLVGDYSFEVCLAHVPLVAVIDGCIRRFGLQKWQLLLWLGGLTFLIVGCCLLRKLTALCMKPFQK